MIENRAGAGGVIATANVVKAAPDGQTLLASASSIAANPKLFKSLPFDTLKDLQCVSLIFRTPLALVVNPKLPVKIGRGVDRAPEVKARRDQFAHSGPGSAIHLAAELFQAMTGTKMNGCRPIAARRSGLTM